MTSEGYIKNTHSEPLDVYFSVNYILYTTLDYNLTKEYG